MAGSTLVEAVRPSSSAPTCASVAWTVLALLPLGCSAADYARRADRSAERLLEPRQESALGAREQTAERPTELAPQPAVPEAEPALEAQPPSAEPEVPALVLDLRAALAIAITSNRTMITSKEALHLQALSLAGVRHSFAPQLALTLGYVFDESAGVPDRNGGAANFSATQILPTGGDLTLNAASNASGVERQAAVYDSLISVRLAQPLLRNAGYEQSHEALIQAERSLIYAIRDFELFREDFSIDVARRYYDLVNQKQSIENQRRNFENNQFGRLQAEALFAVGRATELDVLRARRSELTARNDLLEAEEQLQLARDNFRIFLGLSDQEPVDVQSYSPPFVSVHYDVESAVGVALMNRLDLLNQRERLEDTERALRLSKNQLLPDLDLTLGTSFATADTDQLGGSDLERNNLSLAVTLGVPLDRVNERNAYRAAQIALAQARRELEEFQDQLEVSIRSSFRELERRLQSLDIQSQLIVDQTKNLRIAELRFERGEIENRDVVEANQSLLDAQNALIDEQVNYEIARLQLLRDLGILFIDETGMWK